MTPWLFSFGGALLAALRLARLAPWRPLPEAALGAQLLGKEDPPRAPQAVLDLLRERHQAQLDQLDRGRWIEDAAAWALSIPWLLSLGGVSSAGREVMGLTVLGAAALLGAIALRWRWVHLVPRRLPGLATLLAAPGRDRGPQHREHE
ncbi:MAG: hypothetical protein JXX28_12935 [Deltaproteobacteria bacterium]|nr:hypothetical protein [Deltaproteobacteria bacterium]